MNFDLLITGIVLLILMHLSWWGICKIMGDKWTQSCARCDSHRAPLRWYPIYNAWLCWPCMDREVDISTTALIVEINNRL